MTSGDRVLCLSSVSYPLGVTTGCAAKEIVCCIQNAGGLNLDEVQGKILQQGKQL